MFEIKTKRVIQFSVSPNELFLLLVHSNSLFIDYVLFANRETRPGLIREKHQIISHQIDPSSEFLLINTSFEIPELHLWRLSDGHLLNTFTGHFQRNFVIGCAFLNSSVICCGSENGELLFWHVNSDKPLSILKRHDLSLNSISIEKLQESGETLIATGSDDGRVMISKY